MNGSLCYPSEYIPAMTVYLKSTKSGKIYKLVTKEDQKFFKFSNIPYGEYCCYAYTLDKTVTDIDGNKNKASCGFTKAVVCGLSVDCNDHTLINFIIDKNIYKDTLSVCDFYGAILPPE